MNITVKRIPEDKLSQLQSNHLKIAREIAGNTPIYAASIHDSVPIIGAFELQTNRIFIVPQRLNHLQGVVNTAIHEKAHAISRANDGTKAHEKAIEKLSKEVADKASRGGFDRYLSNAVW